MWTLIVDLWSLSIKDGKYRACYNSMEWQRYSSVHHHRHHHHHHQVHSVDSLSYIRTVTSWTDMASYVLAFCRLSTCFPSWSSYVLALCRLSTFSQLIILGAGIVVDSVPFSPLINHNPLQHMQHSLQTFKAQQRWSLTLQGVCPSSLTLQGVCPSIRQLFQKRHPMASNQDEDSTATQPLTPK